MNLKKILQLVVLRATLFSNNPNRGVGGGSCSRCTIVNLDIEDTTDTELRPGSLSGFGNGFGTELDGADALETNRVFSDAIQNDLLVRLQAASASLRRRGYAYAEACERL